VDRDHPEHAPLAGQLDPDLAANGPAAVGTDQVPGSHTVFAAVVEIADRGRDTVTVIGERHEFVVEAHTARVELLCPGAQQRLQTDLREVRRAVGAGLDVHRVGVPRAPRLDGPDLVAVAVVRTGQPRVPGGTAHVLRRCTTLVDGVRHPDLVEDLHATLIEYMGLGKDRRLGQPADEQRAHAELRQQHRGS
jgi:hypothetical protein